MTNEEILAQFGPREAMEYDVVVVGGGPAGLYFALLMKKSDPRHEVTVVERNRPDDTFGWGVVFSDQTLDNLRQADPESHDAILDAFNHWDDIEIHFKGRAIRSGGHGFCGIGRKQRSPKTNSDKSTRSAAQRCSSLRRAMSRHRWNCG